MKLAKKIIGLSALAALGLGGLGVPLAVAEGGTSSTVNLNEKVSFTITKYKGEVGDTSQPLAGAKFKVEKVTTDNGLDTNQGWEEVAGLSADTACSQKTCTDVKTLETNSTGVATIATTDTSSFTVGVYKVTELPKPGYTVAAPFLITLPYTKDGTWNYSLEAKPKNQLLNPTKTVKDTGDTTAITGTDLGDTITYTINVPVPADPVGEFKIADSLPTGLTPKTAQLTSTPDASLEQNTDYTSTVSDQAVTVTISPAGQQKLKTFREGKSALKLVLTVTAKVTAFPTSGYEFANQAEITYPHHTDPVKTSSSSTFDPTTGDDPSPTLTKYVDVAITKKGNTSKASADLSGAQFELYVCQEKGGKYETVGAALKGGESANATSQQTTFTTVGKNDATKTATVTAYKLQDPRFRNGAALAQAVTYCALETKAPAGFVRDPNPRPVTFAADATTGTVEVIDQEETILSNLPLTGAAGIYTLLTVGAILVAAGFAMNWRRSKKTLNS